MFCGKCGNPLEDDARFCGNCGAPVELEIPAEPAAPVEEAPVAEAAAPAEEVVEVQENVAEEAVQEPELPEFMLNTEGELAKPKKKIGKIFGLIGGIVLVVLIAVLAVAAISDFDGFFGFFTRTFSSPEKQQTKVYEDVVADAFDKLTVSGDNKKGGQSFDPTNMGAEGEMRLTIDDQLLSLIVPANGVDMSWLSDIAIGYDASVKDELYKMVMSVVLGDTTLASADMVMDQESMEYWLSIPELNDKALYINYSEMMEDMGASMVTMMDPETLADYAELLPSQEVLEAIVSRYVSVIMSGFGDVERSTETRKVSGVSQKLHVLKATMDEDDLVDIAENLIKTLKKDKDIKEIILNVEEYVGEEGLYDSFIEAMDEALEALDEDEMDLPSFKLTLLTYLNNANDIVGITVKVSSMGVKLEPLSWVRVEQGKKFASELVISAGTESVVFEGKGEKAKTTNSKYTLSYNGDEILTVKVQDYVSDDTKTAGTLRIIPSENIMDEVMSGADIPEAVLDLIGSADPALEIQFSVVNGESGEYSIALAAGTKKLVTLSVTTKLTAPDAIQIPENVLELKDEESLTEWTEGMNEDFLSALIERLIEAGAPAELFAFAA